MPVDVITQNQQRKARAIAAALYRRGMHVADLAALPYRSRTGPSVSRFCLQAYRETSITAPPPHDRGSHTWLWTARLLAWLEEHPTHERTPARDLGDDRARWIAAPAAAPIPIPVPQPAAARTADGGWLPAEHWCIMPDHCLFAERT